MKALAEQIEELDGAEIYGRVVGVRARQGEKEVVIRSRYGVLCNAGGFARNLTLRAANGPQPASTEWTAVIEGDTGDALVDETAERGPGPSLQQALGSNEVLIRRSICTRAQFTSSTQWPCR